MSECEVQFLSHNFHFGYVFFLNYFGASSRRRWSSIFHSEDSFLMKEVKVLEEVFDGRV